MPTSPSHPSDQLSSPSYLILVEHTNFLLRDEMRAVRFALEYAKADLLLRDWGVRSTIIVFGSARVPSPERAAAWKEAATAPDEKAKRRIERQLRW
ncbi:hypothetical protein [Steroidobacter gossypii]|uniref:hypothetical protein n=1 Tax=Steroidobacter gossypii TaxID=2805490 RepID=UPI001C3FDD71|nr:hypothetical protein [Steroidobacter gossypii]